MEASALSHAARSGLLTRRSPLLKLKGDEQLVALVRSGNSGAFDIIVDRYQARLLGFCRQMIGSTEDAEDVLQEVFVNAYKAMIADSREINLRPWLYRIARNRSLNHLRKPKAVAQESMDLVPMVDAGSTHEKVHNREEFRQLLNDVTKLPETQRAALLLREIDALSYEEIAEAMDTTVPSVKSLLVRARISLAEATQARMLTCGEVRVELAEAAEGLNKASGPVRRHVRDCDECAEFRKQLRSDTKALAMMAPVGALLALKAAIAAKLGLGGAGTAGTAAGTSAGAAGVAGGAGASAGAAAVGAGTAASGIGAVGGAVGAKAIAGVVTAAVITAGAVEVKSQVGTDPVNESGSAVTRTIAADPAPVKAGKAVPAKAGEPVEVAQVVKYSADETVPPPAVTEPVVTEPAVTEEPADPAAPATPAENEADVTGGVETPADANHTATGGADSTVTGGFEGTVIDVPTKTPPPESPGPSLPEAEAPVSSGQIPSQPPAPAPPATKPDIPEPSVPTPASGTTTAP
ncbi:MAG: sigma-70 family RNA polymerase sigma factor [Thermoleophilia bacterium]|nr:sigma-70 family RNA polymerase sigma factor [Thermoleophilia bacterium]